MQQLSSDNHFNSDKFTIVDPSVPRDALEGYVAFSCDLAKIHDAAKRAGISSIQNPVSSYLYHNSDARQRKEYYGRKNLQQFIGCHTVIAVYNRGLRKDKLDINLARSDTDSTGRSVQADDSLMLLIFSDCVTANFPDVMKSKDLYAEQYYYVLINNNYVLGVLEQYQARSDSKFDKADLLAFMFAKLRVLDVNNKYYPLVTELYSKLLRKFKVDSIWRFAKLNTFNSNDLRNDIAYACDHPSHKAYTPALVEVDDLLRNMSNDPYKKYVKQEDKGCIIM